MSIIINKMYEYQKEYNITKECILNFKVLVGLHKGAKFKAVMVLGKCNDTLYINGGHFVVEHNDEIIEASYDVYKIQKRSYYDSLKKILDELNNSKLMEKLQIDKKNIVENFIKFKKLEKCLNDNTYGFNELEKFCCGFQLNYIINN